MFTNMVGVVAIAYVCQLPHLMALVPCGSRLQPGQFHMAAGWGGKREVSLKACSMIFNGEKVLYLASEIVLSI